LRGGGTVIADLNEKMSVIPSFLKKLPIKAPLYHARWCGNEVWAPIGGGLDYKKENETSLPQIGEISITPSGDGFNFGIWYGRARCFSPDGYCAVSIIGKIEGENPEFAKACNNCLLKGADEVMIERG
jgi:hypothetical protein